MAIEFIRSKSTRLIFLGSFHESCLPDSAIIDDLNSIVDDFTRNMDSEIIILISKAKEDKGIRGTDSEKDT